MSIEETRKIIDQIIECALAWCNDDNDDPAPIPPEWETVLPLLRAAPRLRVACKIACAQLHQALSEAKAKPPVPGRTPRSSPPSP